MSTKTKLNVRFRPMWSNPVSFAANQTVTLDKSFLEPARGWSRNAMIEYFALRFQLNVTVGAAGCLGKYWPQLLGRLYIKDGSGERFNLTGYEMRMVEACEMGNAYRDPKNITVGTQNIEFYMRLPLRPLRTHDREDFGINVLELLDQGQIQITWGSGVAGPATNITATNSGTVTAYVNVVDRGEDPTSRARLCMFSSQLINSEDRYAINGNPRMILAAIGPVAQNAGTAWAGGDILSQTLPYPAFASTALVDLYHSENPFARLSPSSISTDPSEDPVIGGEVIPILWPEYDQQAAQHPALQNLHLKFGQGITQANLGSLITLAYLDRRADQVARVLGVQKGGAQTAIAASQSEAAIVPGKDGAVKWRHVEESRRRALPLRIKMGK